MITHHDRMLYELYRGATEGATTETAIAGPLPASATPHLDAVYNAVSGSPDMAPAFTAQYRYELDGRADRPLPLISIAGRAALVSTFIKDGYPPSMQHFGDEATIAKNLRNPTADMFSFVALGEDESKTPTYQAVCTAYITGSRVNPGKGNVLYIDDLVVDPSGQSRRLGILAFREVLTRASIFGQDAIEMRARRQTSYKGFRGPVMARILNSMGYTSTDHGVVAEYGDAEHREYSHLIEVTKLA